MPHPVVEAGGSPVTSHYADATLTGVVYFEPGRLFVYGAAGLWMSTNAGVSWSRTAISDDVADVASDGKSLWVLCADCAIGKGERGSALLHVTREGRVKETALSMVMIHSTLAGVRAVGGREVALRIASAGGDGSLQISADAGRSWSDPLSLPCLPTPAYPVSGDPMGLYDGVLYLACPGRGAQLSMYRSADSGRTWNLLGTTPSRGVATSLVIGDAQRMWRYGNAAPLYRSVDGGRSWTEVTSLPDSSPGLPAITAATASAADVWAFASSSAGTAPAVYTSTDAGAHWTRRLLPIS